MRVHDEGRLKVLILGGQGLVGIELEQALKKEILLVPPKKYGDVTSVEGMQKIFLGFEPDVVVNLAAKTDVDACEMEPGESEAVNAKGAENVALAAEILDQKPYLVMVSSDYVFGDSLSRRVPYGENDPHNPANYYGMTKSVGEQTFRAACQRIGLHHTVVRSSWIYGRAKHGFPEAVMKKMMTTSPSERISVVDDQLGNPTRADDLANFLAEVIRRQVDAPVLHYGNLGVASRYEMARYMAAYAYDLTRDERLNPQRLWRRSTSDLPVRAARRPLYAAMDPGLGARMLGPCYRAWQTAAMEHVHWLFGRGFFDHARATA